MIVAAALIAGLLLILAAFGAGLLVGHLEDSAEPRDASGARRTNPR